MKHPRSVSMRNAKRLRLAVGNYSTKGKRLKYSALQSYMITSDHIRTVTIWPRALSKHEIEELYK